MKEELRKMEKQRQLYLQQEARANWYRMQSQMQYSYRPGWRPPIFYHQPSMYFPATFPPVGPPVTQQPNPIDLSRKNHFTGRPF